MTQEVNQKTYKKLIEQDIEWLKSMIEVKCPNSLEGKHILNILENEKEKSNI